MLQESKKEELEAYGITPDFIDYIRSLNYNAFKDAAEKNVIEDSESLELNKWQLRHAMLVVRVVQEINELRFVLCPRYMPDEHFWKHYFILAEDHLPSISKTWKDGDPLPQISSLEAKDDNFMTFSAVGNQLEDLKRKIQSSALAAAAVVKPHVDDVHVSRENLSRNESDSLIHSDLISNEESNLRDNETNAEGESKAENRGESLIAADPDLEAYLKDVENSGDDIEDDENDLDLYLNDLEGGSKAVGENPSSNDKDLDEDDFENLLNELSTRPNE